MNIKKCGRPRLQIEENRLMEEIEKYLNREQTGIETSQHLKIGKTSFYAILKQRGIKKC